MIGLALFAGLAQLVEHKLPKLGVASSNLVSRSMESARSFVIAPPLAVSDCERPSGALRDVQAPLLGT